MQTIIVAFALPQEQVEINIEGYHIVPVITGITKAYASASLAKAIVDYQPTLILNIGTAGTIRHSVGDIILSTHFIDRDIKLQNFESVNGEIKTQCIFASKWHSMIKGKCVKGDFIVNTGDYFVTEDDHIVGDVVDMEGFANALVAKKLGIDFLAIKYVTDVIGQNSMQIWEDRLSEARQGLSNYFKNINEKNEL